MKFAATDASQAASLAMLATLRVAVGLALWGALLASLTPDVAFRPLRLLHRLFSVETRRAGLLLWHACAAGLAASTAAAIAAAYLKQTSGQSAREFLCSSNFKKNAFSNSKLVASVTLALFLLYARMFVDRWAAAVSGARGSTLFSRVSRAIDAGSLWWLIADASPLSVPLAFALMLDWGTLRLADFAHMRKMRSASGPAASQPLDFSCGTRQVDEALR